MKLTIESTGTMATYEGATVRVWDGMTDDGFECKVFVKAVVFREGAEPKDAADLIDQSPPAEIVSLLPILDSLLPDTAPGDMAPA